MTQTMRTENDSLGAVKLPKDALYGAQTQRAIENYPISGRTAHPELLSAYLKVKKAAAIANKKAKVLSSEKAKLIIRAVDEIFKIPEKSWPEIFPVDPYQAGAGTSQNMNLNEVIANVGNKLKGHPLGSYKPLHPNDDVNCSQSTNDTFPTATRLALLEASLPLVTALSALANSFSAKSKKWMPLLKSARTHLQDAVPMRFGQEIGAYAATLIKCRNWMEEGRNQLRILGIGGSAVGTGLNVPASYPKDIVQELSRLTREKLFLSKNLCEAMQSQSPLLFYSSMLRLMAIELTRICNDLRLLASGPLTGLAEILLPAVQPGSSIMPGKVNPSILEMANQTWYSVLGYDQTVAFAVQAGQLELNVMMPIMAYSALEATKVATSALHILKTKCIDGIEPNPQKLRKYFESTPQIATALSPQLGYEQTAKLVKESLETGKSVVELIKEKKLLTVKELSQLLQSYRLKECESFMVAVDEGLADAKAKRVIKTKTLEQELDKKFGRR